MNISNKRASSIGEKILLGGFRDVLHYELWSHGFNFLANLILVYYQKWQPMKTCGDYGEGVKLQHLLRSVAVRWRHTSPEYKTTYLEGKGKERKVERKFMVKGMRRAIVKAVGRTIV